MGDRVHDSRVIAVSCGGLVTRSTKSMNRPVVQNLDSDDLATVTELPRRGAAALAGSVASSIADRVVAPVRPFWPANSVDDWGRDPNLIAAIAPFARLRWNTSVSGDQHLPVKTGALLVCNSRRWSLASIYASLALSEVTDRPVRFAGRSDRAPTGPLLRRLGGILSDPGEIAGALADNELVLMTAASTAHPRHAGAVDPILIGVAIQAGVQIYPVATISPTVGRTTRVEVGHSVRPRRKRRGPLGDIEMADAARHAVQTMLDSMGGVHIGVAPIDWVAG